MCFFNMNVFSLLDTEKGYLNKLLAPFIGGVYIVHVNETSALSECYHEL